MWGTQWRARLGKSVGKSVGKSWEKISWPWKNMDILRCHDVTIFKQHGGFQHSGINSHELVFAVHIWESHPSLKTGRDRVIIPGMNWVWLWKISLRPFWTMKSKLCPRIHWRENLQETLYIYIFGVKTIWFPTNCPTSRASHFPAVSCWNPWCLKHGWYTLKWPNKAENDQTKPDEWRNYVIKVYQSIIELYST